MGSVLFSVKTVGFGRDLGMRWNLPRDAAGENHEKSRGKNGSLCKGQLVFVKFLPG